MCKVLVEVRKDHQSGQFPKREPLPGEAPSACMAVERVCCGGASVVYVKVGAKCKRNN